MDEAARIRRAATDAVADIEPPRLRADIADALADCSMAPGALAVLSARAIDETTPIDPVVDRGAGVQLIYDGLRLTRALAREEPWDGRRPDEHTGPNLDVLAADVLVSRGFYLLARTEAAEKAVATVQAFGRAQTLRRGADPDDAAEFDRTLETNVLELAVIAGATAADGPTPPGLLEFADELGRSVEPPLPSAGELLPDGLESALGSAVGDGARADEHVHQSATDH